MTLASPPLAKKRIVILDDWEQNFQRQASSQLDWAAVNHAAQVVTHYDTLRGAALLAALVDADAVVLMRDRTPFTADLIAQLPRLKYVVFTGTRNTQLDFAALAARNIPVGCTAFGPSKENTCEITWGLILGAVKQLESNFALMRNTATASAATWRSPQGTQPMSILSGQRLGVVGLGEIGGRVAKVGLAFGMEVVCWSPNMTAERAAAQGVTAVGLDELLQTSKIVTLHIVPSTATQHFMNAPRLAMMRRDAVLVNTARASLVDMPALYDSLRATEGDTGCRFAGIDVYDEEPVPANHPLRTLPNAVLTPHVGFVCEPVFNNFDTGVAQCLAAWVQGLSLVRSTTG